MRVGINGMGRTGRAVFRSLNNYSNLELVAINDIVSVENLAYLLKYDSVYGTFPEEISFDERELKVGAKSIPLFRQSRPGEIPWQEVEVDIVLECSGAFLTKEKLDGHFQAGAKKVIVSAPTKSEGIPLVVFGVNDVDNEISLLSCASCTTNCIAPVVEIVGRRLGIEKAILTTAHGYTSTQGIVDGPNKKLRRGRAAAVNMVPTSTGAAKATTEVLPQYKDLFDGSAIRCPVPSGSISDITIVTSQDTTVDEVNNIFQEEAKSKRYLGVLGTSDEPLVSTDILGDPRASIIDLDMTLVVDGNLVKIMSWYDNEMGYANQMLRQVSHFAG